MLLLLVNYIDIEQQEQTQQSVDRLAHVEKVEDFSLGTQESKSKRRRSECHEKGDDYSGRPK
jgi:hypothetical protein